MSEFSEFKITNMSIMFEKEISASKFGCIGSLEETLNTKTIVKKCEGITTKNKTIPTGDGELKLLVHIELEAFNSAFGMDNDELKEGVHGYGKFQHKQFALTGEVYNEDDVKKYKAYPNCVISNGISRKIENGAEEVAELEMTIAVAADKNGYCMYEALDSELKDEETKEKWLKGFTPDLVKKAEN